MARTSCEFNAMGSPFQIQVDYPDGLAGDVPGWISALFEKLQREVELMEAHFSRFRPTSELTRFNAHIGNFVPMTPCFRQLLEIAEQMHQLTEGAFDPRVLRHMERIGYNGSPLPSHGEHVIANPAVQDRLVEWNEAAMARSDQPIDFGGIAKGYAADRMADLLDDALPIMNFNGYIVDAGGDLVIRGCQSSGEPWSIGLENPFAPQDLAAAITMPVQQRTAVCTSSLWKKCWVHESEQVHHLIDPSNGRPMETDKMSVTTISASAVLSEALTKYVFLRGTSRNAAMTAIPWSTIVIGKDRTIHMTDDALPFLAWISPDLLSFV